jgi:hypothetical protein
MCAKSLCDHFHSIVAGPQQVSRVNSPNSLLRKTISMGDYLRYGHTPEWGSPRIHPFYCL